jgi:hypothetical protein
MRLYVFLSALVLLAGCPGPGQELEAQSPARKGTPFVRPAPEPPAPQIAGPDTVQPFHLGRYRVPQEWPFYEWRVEPAGADVQPIGNGNVADIVAKPGKYTITVTVGGRRGKSQDVAKTVEFLGEVPPVVSPPDPVVDPPDPGVNPPPVPAVPGSTAILY